jgi:hypothetical protein
MVLILLLSCHVDKLAMAAGPPFVIAVAIYVEGKCGLRHKTKGSQFNTTITFATTKTATAE